MEQLVARHTGSVPALREIWWAALAAALVSGSLFTLLARGASFGRRIVGAALCGVVTGVASSLITWGMGGWSLPEGELALLVVWRAFALAVLTPLGAILTELSLPEPG